MSWPRNHAAIKDATWSIYTENPEEVEKIVSRLGIKVEFKPLPNTGGSGEMLTTSLVQDLDQCEKNDEALITIQPDTIFGEGTLETLVKSGRKGIAVSVAHPRVLSDTFPELKGPTSNAKLVGLAFDHLHPLWVDSNMDAEVNNVFISGVGWKKLSQDLYSVAVRIPTPYYINPLQSDVEYLKNLGAGGWDHHWPRHLIREQRQRLIGSSDAAFMVELTEPTRPSNQKTPRNALEPDHYRVNDEHHKVNRNSLVIWRAER